MKKVFVTGATGFLGSYLLKRLLDNEDISPVVLVRSKNKTAAADRIAGTLKYFYGKDRYKVMMKRIRVIDGEVDNKSLGMDQKTRKALSEEIDEIYHSAAIAEFRVPLEIIRKSNVNGVANVMDFALECQKNGRLKRINHVSTTYLAGDEKGVFHENELDVGQKFNNTYEQSKFEAEVLIQSYREKGLPVTIFRPSILTGDFVSGKTSNFKMLYQPLRFFALELFETIPADRNALENLMPVNAVAEEIYLIANEKGIEGKTYHISNPVPVKAGHFMDVASDYFGFKKPEFISMEDFNIRTLTDAQRILIEPFIPYFNYTLSFDRKNTEAVLTKKGYKCPEVNDEVLLKLFKFCRDSGFIKPKRHYVVTG